MFNLSHTHMFNPTDRSFWMLKTETVAYWAKDSKATAMVVQPPPVNVPT